MHQLQVTNDELANLRVSEEVDLKHFSPFFAKNSTISGCDVLFYSPLTLPISQSALEKVSKCNSKVRNAEKPVGCALKCSVVLF